MCRTLLSYFLKETRLQFRIQKQWLINPNKQLDGLDEVEVGQSISLCFAHFSFLVHAKLTILVWVYGLSFFESRAGCTTTKRNAFRDICKCLWVTGEYFNNTNMDQTLQLHSLVLSSNLCSGLFYIPACIGFLSGFFFKQPSLLLFGLRRKQTTKTICRRIIAWKLASGDVQSMAQSKGIKLQTSSPSPSERLGELRMDDPLGPTRAAKSCRLTGNEGPLESKQTAYHEVRHPERQLSHWGWDQFMGNYGLFKTPIWNRFTRNLAVKTGDQWWVVTPSASSRLTSSVLLNAASVTRQPLKKTICRFMHLLSCRYMYKRLPGNETSCTWPQPSTSLKPWEVRTDGCDVNAGADGKSVTVGKKYWGLAILLTCSQHQVKNTVIIFPLRLLQL